MIEWQFSNTKCYLRDIKRRQKAHKKAVKAARSTVSHARPQIFQHVNNDAKGRWIRQQRLQEIQLENSILHEKVSKIFHRHDASSSNVVRTAQLLKQQSRKLSSSRGIVGKALDGHTFVRPQSSTPAGGSEINRVAETINRSMNSAPEVVTFSGASTLDTDVVRPSLEVNNQLAASRPAASASLSALGKIQGRSRKKRGRKKNRATPTQFRPGMRLTKTQCPVLDHFVDPSSSSPSNLSLNISRRLAEYRRIREQNILLSHAVCTAAPSHISSRKLLHRNTKAQNQYRNLMRKDCSAQYLTASKKLSEPLTPRMVPQSASPSNRARRRSTRNAPVEKQRDFILIPFDGIKPPRTAPQRARPQLPEGVAEKPASVC